MLRDSRATGARPLTAALAVAALGAGLCTAAPSASATPPPAPPVEVMPGATMVSETLITDDAVYVVSTAPDSGAVIRGRSLTSAGPTWSLGPAQLVGRAVSDDVAASAGRIAYVRAADHRLVLDTLVAPGDGLGAEVTPVWSLADGVVTDGVWGLSGSWVTIGDRDDQRLFDVDSGTEVDLGSVTPLPGDADDAPIAAISVGDGVVVWSVWTTVDGMSYSGVYRATLAADGAMGPVEVLDEDLATSPDDPPVLLIPAPLQDGDTAAPFVAWSRLEMTGFLQFTHELRWLTSASTVGSPEHLAVPEDASLLSLSDGVVTMGVRSGEQVTVSWYDLAAGPAELIRTWVGPEQLTGLAGTLVAYDSAGTSWLVDAVGLAIDVDTTPLAPLAHFSDVNTGETFGGEILWLADRGVVGGYSDGSFRRAAPVNRDAMAAFLYRLVHDPADTPEPCAEAPFADVPVSHPFCPQITWLAGTGITKGWPDGTFRPSQPVSREAMTAFLYRFANEGGTAPACTSAPFTDVVVAHQFCGEIAWLRLEGLSTGWPDGTFRPGSGIERQAMAAFLFRFDRDGYVPRG